MTSARVALLVLLVGCARPSPPSVTVLTALPKAQPPVVMAEPEESFGCSIYAQDGVSENPVAFRTCIESAVATETVCEDGGSPDLPTLELAVEHADAKAKDASTPALGGCTAFAMTTLASTDCLTEHVTSERAWLRRMRRDYGEGVRVFFDDATRAAKAHTSKLGEVVYTMYAGGTMRGPAMQSKILEAMRKRRARLEGIRAWSAKSPSAEERASARQDLVHALSALRQDADPEVVTALRAEEEAWLTYREAEAALYEQLHPGARDAIALELALEHARSMCELSAEP